MKPTTLPCFSVNPKSERISTWDLAPLAYYTLIAAFVTIVLPALLFSMGVLIASLHS